jgi:hypothetical protein
MGIVISTFAMMNDGEMVSHDNPTGSKLEDNEEYQRLMAENDTLVIMCDSINTLLKEIKEERRLYLDTLTTEPSPEVMHKYSQRIINLEDKYTYNGEHLKVETADGKKYEMYYYPAVKGSQTEVKVPEGDIKYEISGDNVNGYIITMEVK